MRNKKDIFKLLDNLSLENKVIREKAQSDIRYILSDVFIKISDEEGLIIAQKVMQSHKLENKEKRSLIFELLINRSFESLMYIYENIGEDKKIDFLKNAGSYFNITLFDIYNLNSHYLIKTKKETELELFKNIMDIKKEEGLYYYQLVSMLEANYPKSALLEVCDRNIHNYLNNNTYSERSDPISFHLCSRLSSIKVKFNDTINYDKQTLCEKNMFNKIMQDINLNTDYYREHHPGVIFIYNFIVSLKNEGNLRSDFFMQEFNFVEDTEKSIPNIDYLKDHCINKIIKATRKSNIENEKEENHIYALFEANIEKHILNNSIEPENTVQAKMPRI